MNNAFKFGILFIIWYPFRSVVRFLSTRRNKYNRLFVFGDILGSFLCLIFKPGREYLKKEFSAMNLYKPEYVKKTFQHIMRIEMEGMVFEDLNRALIEQITVFEGLDYLDRSLKKKNGVMLVLFHFGWHMHTIPALGYMGYNIKQIADARPVRLDRELGFFHRKVIEKRLYNARNLPVEFIEAGAYMRPVMRILKDNNVLILAIDGREARSFRSYDFLGRKIRLSPLALKMASTTNTPVHPMFTYRGEDNRHRLMIHPRLEYDNPDQGVEKLLEQFKSYMEKCPFQYAQYILENHLASGNPERELEPLFI